MIAGSNCSPRAAPQLLEAGVGVERLAVGPLERHRVVGVDHAHGARDQGDLLAAQAVRVAVAVPALVVMAHAQDELLLEQRADDVGAEHRVLAHEVPLLGVQLARLEQDAVGDADLADVVQVGGFFGAADALLGPAQLGAQQHHVGRHAGRVAEGVGVLGVQGRAQRLEVAQVHRLDVRIEAGVLDGQGELRAHALQQPGVERVEGLGARVVQHEPAGKSAVEDEGHDHGRADAAELGVRRGQRVVVGQAQDGDGVLAAGRRGTTPPRPRRGRRLERLGELAARSRRRTPRAGGRRRRAP